MSEQLTPDVIHDRVLSVLREIIGNDAITPADDFFLAGGHSLLIVRIIRCLRTEHGVELTPRQFGVNSQVAAIIAACRPVSETG